MIKSAIQFLCWHLFLFSNPVSVSFVCYQCMVHDACCSVLIILIIILFHESALFQTLYKMNAYPR